MSICCVLVNKNFTYIQHVLIHINGDILYIEEIPVPIVHAVLALQIIIITTRTTPIVTVVIVIIIITATTTTTSIIMIVIIVIIIIIIIKHTERPKIKNMNSIH